LKILQGVRLSGQTRNVVRKFLMFFVDKKKSNEPSTAGCREGCNRHCYENFRYVIGLEKF
jgi:hypothetical protein